MTSASPCRALRRSRRRPRPAVAAAAATALGLVVLATGCGGSNGPGIAGSGSNRTGASTAAVVAQALAYTRCMRGHGISDFPEPTTGGGGVAFQINGGPGSDLDRNDPRFQAAEQACHELLPGGGRSPAPPSATRLAQELSWARCMRAHGLPGFPDPNSQGAFDSSRFDENSPAFQTASGACLSLQPSGATPVEPGRGG